MRNHKGFNGLIFDFEIMNFEKGYVGKWPRLKESDHDTMRRLPIVWLLNNCNILNVFFKFKEVGTISLTEFFCLGFENVPEFLQWHYQTRD